MPFPNAGQVNSATIRGVSSFLLAKMNTQQTTNIAANDHIKYDTLIGSRGSEISVDVSTAYTNATGGTTPGTASIGRFFVKGGLTYRLTGSIPYILGSGATGLLEFGWFDTLNNVELPATRGLLMVATTATHEAGSGDAEAIFSPGSDTLIELRITTVAALTQIGITSTRPPVAYIETL